MTEKEELREKIRTLFLDSGAVACGFASAEDVDASCMLEFREWIEGGYHAGMDYLPVHIPLRQHPDSILPGTSTVVSLGFAFKAPEMRFPVASYAVGRDYHKEIKKRLRMVQKALSELIGEEGRLCVDSAPLAERYWAVKSGIGTRCLSGMTDVKGYGICCFLAEVLLRTPLPPDVASGSRISCGECGKCKRACPSGAIRGDGTVDARRCLSYLTIEHKGSFPESQGRVRLPKLFGCDLCISVCPLAKARGGEEKLLPEFAPREDIVSLTAEKILAMDEESYDRTIMSSPLRRAGLESLKRNAEAMK